MWNNTRMGYYTLTPSLPSPKFPKQNLGEGATDFVAWLLPPFSVLENEGRRGMG